MSMIVHSVVQGSPEWHALRQIPNTFTASEAPAMMNASSKMTRAKLLEYKATGIGKEVSNFVQIFLFDKGHAVEKQFLPHACVLAGEDLHPVTGTREIDGLIYLASCDGLDMAWELGYEHKMRNAALAAYITEHDEPDPERYWQLEHQLLVTGADKILLVTSDGTMESATYCWYASKPERREALKLGWKIFADDLAKWTPGEIVEAPAGESVESLPALVVNVQGELSVGGNIAEWRASAEKWLAKAPSEFKTDQDFANADTFGKACGEAEARLDVVMAQAMAGSKPLEDLMISVKAIQAQFAEKRLALERVVKFQKESIKTKAVTKAATDLMDYLQGVNKDLGGTYLPTISGKFAEAIKGKRSLTSMQASLDAELANCKLTAETIAKKIRTNLSSLKTEDQDHTALFPDLKTVVTKEPDDFAAILQNRVTAHQAAIDKAAEKATADALAKAAAAPPPAPAAAPAQQTHLHPVSHGSTEDVRAQSPAAASLAPRQSTGLVNTGGYSGQTTAVRREVPDPFATQRIDRSANVSGGSFDEEAIRAGVEAFLEATPMPNLQRNLLRTSLMDYERFKAGIRQPLEA